LEEQFYDAPITSFSGGYRMRAKLLRLLGQHPNLMLLDEPTNYLDLETTIVLERFLQGYDGAFMLISHDREFLKRTTDHILEIEAGDATKYNGNIDDYFEQKELLRSQLEARAMTMAQKKKEILDFVARFGAKATKASQAQSRLKQLDRMETIEVKALPVTAKIRIPEPSRIGKLVLDFKHCDLGYADKTVLTDVNLQINGGDHVAVVGFNGAGKSTFLKSIAGQLPLLSGQTETGYEITIGYYAQHVAHGLNPRHTVFEAMGDKAHSSVLPQDVLDLAGALLFSGDAVKKSVSVLSGGEKARVSLGQILLQKCSCLVLDEPTNHLDFQTVEALTQALASYPGTVVVVSHDRGFIRRLGTKILEVRDGRVNLYHGSYDDYVWKLQRQLLNIPEPAPAKTKTKAAAAPSVLTLASTSTPVAAAAAEAAPAPSNAEYREYKKSLDKELRQLERKLADLDKAIADHNAKVAEINITMATSNPTAAAQLVKDLNACYADLHKAEEDWMWGAERKERIVKEIADLAGK
jgi:ATP-binding cassette subfamily F protein 3